MVASGRDYKIPSKNCTLTPFHEVVFFNSGGMEVIAYNMFSVEVVKAFHQQWPARTSDLQSG